MPIPKTPPPNARAARPQKAEAPQKSVRPMKAAQPQKAAKAPVEMANDLGMYLEFVEKHPAGTKVKAVVHSYAANGITVRIGNIAGYVPLRNMANPMPRSARDLFKIGDAVTLMVSGYTPARRSVDLGVPEVVIEMMKAPAVKKAGKKASKKSASVKTVVEKVAPAKKTVLAKKVAPAKAPVAKKAVAKKATPSKKAVVAKKSAPVKAVVAKKAAVKKVAPAKKAPAKAVVKKAVSKKK
jgi:hypothetical protein